MGSPVFIFATTSFVAVILTAALISQYQRDTTSVEDKYTNRSAEEIDATYHQSYLDEGLITEDGFYDDNIIADDEVTGSPIATQASNNPNDFDNDGIPNASDPDPRNPDSDGDGSIDGQDPAPTNPNTGKTATPTPPPPAEPAPQAGELVIGDFYTNVRNLSRGATRWGTHTDAKPGDQLSFIIYAVLTNTSEYAEYKATIFDRLDSHLRYSGGTVSINNDAPLSLPSDGWMGGYVVRVPAGQVKIVEIRFSATASLSNQNQIWVAPNYAWVVTDTKDREDDVAFVTINSYLNNL